MRSVESCERVLRTRSDCRPAHEPADQLTRCLSRLCHRGVHWVNLHEPLPGLLGTVTTSPVSTHAY